jgi:hypothetical protein
MTTTVNTSTQTTSATLETAKARALHFVDGIHGTVFLTQDGRAFHFDGKNFVLKSTDAMIYLNEIAFEHEGSLIVSSNGRFVVAYKKEQQPVSTETVKEFDKFVAQINATYQNDVSIESFEEFKKLKSNCKHLVLNVGTGLHLFFDGAEVTEWYKGTITKIDTAKARELADRCYLVQYFDEMMK